MKKILLLGTLLIALMLITTPITYASESPPGCDDPSYPCLNYVGPPVIGTLVVDYVRTEGPYIYNSYVFNGCCADCFRRCNAACNISIKFEKPFTFYPEDLFPINLLYYKVPGGGPKNCLSRAGGEDLIVTNILKFDKKDIDRDGVTEVVADIIMYYWQCSALCPNGECPPDPFNPPICP